MSHRNTLSLKTAIKDQSVSSINGRSAPFDSVAVRQCDQSGPNARARRLNRTPLRPMTRRGFSAIERPFAEWKRRLNVPAKGRTEVPSWPVAASCWCLLLAGWRTSSSPARAAGKSDERDAAYPFSAERRKPLSRGLRHSSQAVQEQKQ